MVLNTDRVTLLIVTSSSVATADAVPVNTRRRWRNDNPAPVESSRRASSVSLLTGNVIWISFALRSPHVAISSVIENRSYIFFDPVPGDSLRSTFLTPNTAVLILALSWADLNVSVADFSVINNQPADSESAAIECL
jgi:hypothetical protein